MPVMMFEPYFSSFGGHYARFVQVVGAEARRRGDRLIVAASGEVTREIGDYFAAQGIEILPVFRRMPFGLPPTPETRRGLLHLLTSGINEALQRRRPDQIAWLSGNPNMVEAVAALAERYPRKFPFQFTAFDGDWPEGPKGAPKLIRRQLKKAQASGMELFAESEFVARVVRSECDTRCSVMPQVLDRKPLPPPKPVGDKPTVGLLSMMYDYKRPLLAAQALLPHARHLRIIYHFGRVPPRQEDEILPLLESMGAEIRRGALTPEDYEQTWSELDAVVISHDPASYRRRGSGIVAECLADGIVPVVPSGTSMEADVRPGQVGVVYDGTRPEALSEAIGTLIENHAALKERSHAYAETWRAMHSPARLYDVLERCWR